MTRPTWRPTESDFASIAVVTMPRRRPSMLSTLGHTLLVSIMLCLMACGDDTNADDAGTSADDTGANSGTDLTLPDIPDTSEVCDLSNLIAQCPPGSNPRATVASSETCVGDLEITGNDGSVSGVCVGATSCYLVCDFQDPCPCGIERIDDTGVYCFECEDTPACGDAVCEGQEDPQSCSVDCGERCAEDEERCFGDARQLCDLEGLWETVTCRPEQTCDFGAVDSDIKTVCQTLQSPTGGTIPDLGTASVEVTGHPEDIRFPGEMLAIPEGCHAYAFTDVGANVLAVCGPVSAPTEVVKIDREGTEISRVSLLGAEVASRGFHFGIAATGWPFLRSLEDDAVVALDPAAHEGAFRHFANSAWDYTGDLVVAGYDIGLSVATAQHTIVAWDANTGELTGSLSLGASSGGELAVSANGAAVAMLTGGEVAVFNLEEGRLVGRFGASADTGELAFAVGGRPIVFLGGSRGVREGWDIRLLAAGEPEMLWHVEEMNNIGGLVAQPLDSVAPDGSALGVGGRLVDALTGEVLRDFTLSGTIVDFHPNGHELLLSNGQIMRDSI